MTNYKNLHKGIDKELKEKIKDNNYWILHGYGKNYTQEQREAVNDRDNSLQRNSTPTRWTAYKEGRLKRSEAVKFAQERAEREEIKRAEKQRAKLRAAEEATPTPFIDISINWTRSKVWGMNPTAEVRTNSYTVYTGRASGCGYDKESAAVADCFNNAPEILTHIYKLANGKKSIPYGANYCYYCLPRFDGGVGMSSFIKVLEACGFKLEHEAHGKTYDGYYLIKK